MTRTHHRGIAAAGAVAAVLALGLTLGACSQGDDDSGSAAGEASEALPQDIRDRGVLRFGSALNQTPWSFKDDDHEPAGIDIDICTAIADRLGVEADWADLDFQGLIPGLQAGRFDASCAGIYITSEREDVVTLIPYLDSGLSVLVQEDSGIELAGLDDLCGRSVSTLQGSSQEQTVKEQSDTCASDGKEPVSVSSFDTQPMAVQELHNGRVDAFVASDQLSGYYATQYEGLKVAVSGINAVQVGIAIPKDAPELAEAFETELRKMAEDGTYEEILAEWGTEDAALEDLGGDPGE